MRRFCNASILMAAVFVLLLFFQTSAARDLTIVTPEEAGLSARKLAKIDKLIKNIISQEKLKGELHQKRLLKPATVEMMTQNQIGRLSIWWSGPTAKYGFGFSVSEKKYERP